MKHTKNARHIARVAPSPHGGGKGESHGNACHKSLLVRYDIKYHHSGKDGERGQEFKSSGVLGYRVQYTSPGRRAGVAAVNVT